MAYLVELWNSIHILSDTRPWLVGLIVVGAMMLEGLFIALTLESAVKLLTTSARRPKRRQ